MDALELERGEDIDTCFQALTGSDAGRLLEQIKQLDGNVTLRTAATLEFLASALEHRATNQSLSLNFRFVSTARPGIEKPTPLTPREPAIVAWTAASKVQASVATQTIAALRQILSEVSRPKDFSTATWERFTNFVATCTNDDFHAFMTRIEWALGTGDSATVRKRAQALLAQRLNATGTTVVSAYRDLFFFVFDALSSPGPKRLTGPDLDRQVGSRWQERCPDTTLMALEALYSGQETRLDDFEERLTELDKIVRNSDLPEKFSASRPLPTTTLPPAVPKLVPRPAVAKQLSNAIDQSSLVLLRAEHGFGKTQIARVFASASTSAWLRIRNTDDVDVAVTDAISFANKNKNSLLVLDSLPRLSSDSPAVDALTQLPGLSFKILATSLFPLPAQLCANLGTACTQIELLPFNRNEILDLISLFPQSEPVRNKQFADFLLQLTNGHPTLIRAILAFLEGKQWGVDTSTLSNLLAGSYAQSAKADALRLFADTVSEQASRELVYRIDVARFPSSRAEVELVSRVTPSIGLPFEKLESMRGVWIQETETERWRLSPLIANAAATKLDTEIRMRIEMALGESLVASRVIDLSAFERALIHFVAAEAYHRASALYAMGVQSYCKDVTSGDPAPILSLFPSTIPQSAPASARALVLYSQLRLLDKTKRDPTTVLARLREVLENSALTLDDNIDAGLLAAALGSGAFRIPTDRLVAIQFTSISFLLTENAPAAVQELKDASHALINVALWLCIAGARRPAELRAWATLIAKVPPDRINASLGATPHAHETIDLAIKVVVQETAKKTQEEWEDLVRTLAELETVPQSFIASVASAGKIYGFGIREDLENVDKVSRTALEKPIDPPSSFVLHETLGIALDDAGLPGAEAQLLEAESLGLSTFSSTRIDGLRRIARIRAETKPEAAVASAEAALQLARSVDLQSSRLIRILTELAILVADARGPRDAFPYFDEAASRLFAQSQESAEDKALFVLVGHTIGYYAGIATGSPVSTTADGSPYTKPSVSIFFGITTMAAVLYRQERRAFLPAILARYAQAINDDSNAERWGEKSTIALETADADTRALLSHGALPFQLRNNAFGLAIDMAAKKLPAPPGGAQEFKPEILAIASTLFPALARAATLKINNSQVAKSAAEELANACRKRGQDSGEQLWGLAEKVVRLSLLETVEQSVLDELVSEAQNTKDPFIQGVAQVAYSLHPALEPKQILARQLSAFMEYERGPAKLSPGIHRFVIVPFLVDFWSGKIEAQRFRFAAPKILSMSLSDAAELPGAQGVRAIFNSLILSLGVRAPDWATAWLSEK